MNDCSMAKSLPHGVTAPTREATPKSKYQVFMALAPVSEDLDKYIFPHLLFHRKSDLPLPLQISHRKRTVIPQSTHKTPEAPATSNPRPKTNNKPIEHHRTKQSQKAKTPSSQVSTITAIITMNRGSYIRNMMG